MNQRRRRLALAVSVTIAGLGPSAAQERFGLPLEGAEAEQFLRTARVVDRKPLGTGITRSDRLTLTDGQQTLHCVFKVINEHNLGLTRMEALGQQYDFRDSYKGEIAAYELDKLLGLGLVPPTVERRIEGRTGSLQMWVEATMTEHDRKTKGLEPPDRERWNEQMHTLRLLHELTYDTDLQNIRNVLVDPSFRIYAIDFSRAFHIQTDLLAPGDLVRFSRSAIEALGKLDRPLLKEHLGRWIGDMQIVGLLKRRDRILALVREHVAEKGEADVLYP